jgi:UDP-GlcNAc:undecaprenyl-phosphate GlcNAc-1-phosphate transferase
MIHLIVFLAAFGTAVLLTPMTRVLSSRLGIVAEPGGRRRHHGRIPKLGGIPIFIAYLVGIALAYNLLPPVPGSTDERLLPGIIWGSVIVFVGGLCDDKWDLPARFQFLFHVAGAVVAISYEIFIERFTNPLPTDAFWTWGPMPLFFTVEGSLIVISKFLVYIITLFWVLGMINTVNWMDGLDGLAAGIGIIATILFAWHSYFNLAQTTTVPLFPLALAGALLGFLFFNFAPARIFLGTAGAWLLGYNLATLSILSPAKLSTALLVMAVPILDVAWQIFDRIRRGQHPYQGDRGHLHFRLFDSGLPTRLIVIGYYVVALAFGLVAILVSNRLLKIGLWLALGTAVLIFLSWLTVHTRNVGREV